MIRYAIATSQFLLLLMWAGVAAASSIVLKDGTNIEIDGTLILLTMVVSTLAGATTLAIRVNGLLAQFDAEGKQRPLVRPWLFVSAHMMGSWLAGLAMFIVSRMNGWDVWTSLLLVLLLSFMGSKGIEMLAEKYLPVIPTPKTP